MSFTQCRIVCNNANPKDYHRQEVLPGLPDYVISSSSLREFARCPSRWKAGYRTPDTSAKEWGSVLDCLLLTPDQFKSRYAVKPPTYTNEKGEVKPWNGNANVCKAWLEDHNRFELVSTEDALDARTAIDRLRSDPVISDWHKASDTQVWIAGEWKDEKSGIVIPVRCLLDYLPRPGTEWASCAGDLKTTRSAHPLVFQRQCYQMGWHWQAAFDLDMLVAATGEDRNTWVFIVQENFPPWEAGKRMLSQDFLTLGRQSYQHALSRYAQCHESAFWPGYDDHADAVDGFSVVEAEPWMAFETMQQSVEEDQTAILSEIPS